MDSNLVHFLADVFIGKDATIQDLVVVEIIQVNGISTTVLTGKGREEDFSIFDIPLTDQGNFSTDFSSDLESKVGLLPLSLRYLVFGVGTVGRKHVLTCLFGQGLISEVIFGNAYTGDLSSLDPTF